MKVWLPMIESGGGADVLTDLISEGLNSFGWHTERYQASHVLTFFPWLERRISPPPATDLIATHSWFGAAYYRPGIPLVVIEHLFTLDQELSSYRSIYQNIFHQLLVRKFIAYSYEKAAVTVAVSNFTHRQITNFSPGTRVKQIYNGTDLDFFFPSVRKNKRTAGEPLKLLFVGNLIIRKGVDLLPEIIDQLGDGFQLNYTSGLRTRSVLDNKHNAKCLGKLNPEQIRAAYLDADLLLFPSRMEGLPLAVIEAAACGLPAVASNVSSMPEVIIDGETGKLCEPNVEDYVSAIRELAEDRTRLSRMGENARALAERQFDAKNMVNSYRLLFEQVLDEQPCQG